MRKSNSGIEIAHIISLASYWQGVISPDVNKSTSLFYEGTQIRLAFQMVRDPYR
jgi:hypothetical protein